MPQYEILHDTKNEYSLQIWRFLLSVLYTAGTLLLLDSCAGTAWNRLFYAASIGGAALLCVLLTVFSRKKTFPPVILPFLALVFAVAGGLTSLYRGIFGMANALLARWNEVKEDGLPLFEAGNASARDATLFFIVFTLLFFMLVWLLFYRYRGILLLLMFANIAVSQALDRCILPACALLLFAVLMGWIILLPNRVLRMTRLWAAVLAGILAVAVLVLAGRSSATMDVIREAAKTKVHDLRYGENTLPDGDLYQAHTMLDGDADALNVTEDRAAGLYLRGFVAGRYRNGCWETLPDSAYGGDYRGIFDWLNEEDFSPQTQYSSYTEIGEEEKEGETGTAKNTVSVENVGATREYAYLPYSSVPLSEEGMSADRDNGYLGKGISGIRTYSFEDCAGDLPGELMELAGWVKAPATQEEETYADAEAVYRDFVYENYLTVDASCAAAIHSIFREEEEHSVTEGIYAVTEKIRETLSERLSYREIPSAIPSTEEPILYSLTESHEGNAAIFASIAVMAFRDYGIPARYAEGYYLSEDSAQAGESVRLTQKESHAWAEVYMDGVGWLPIDVTPGYYYDEYTLQQLIERPKDTETTVTVEEEEREASELEESSTAGGDAGDGENAPKIKEIVLIFRGILTVILIVLAVCFLVLELLAAYSRRRLRRLYREGNARQRTALLLAIFRKMTAAMGIAVCMGWNTRETERQLRECVPSLKEEEYFRFNQVIEKALYGEEALRPHEERLSRSFFDKIYRNMRRTSLRNRIRLHLAVLGAGLSYGREPSPGKSAQERPTQA